MQPHGAPPRRLDGEEVQALGGLVALFLITAAWWSLALWPVSSAPVWLERTRYVCFGVGESGLPDRGGWIGLIGGPAGMLFILVVGWSRGMRGLVSRARVSRAVAATLTALAAGCLVLLMAAAALVQQARSAVTQPMANYSIPPKSHPRLDRAAPPLSLTAQTGETIDLAGFAGTPVLVTFAYAHCTTICPVIVHDALRAQEALRGSPDEPAVLIVTLDPWRDPPSRLPAMAQSWRLPDDGAWVLSGSVEAVQGVLDRWEVSRSRDLTTGEVTHPSLVYIVDRDGRLAYASTGGADALVSLVLCLSGTLVK